MNTVIDVASIADINLANELPDECINSTLVVAFASLDGDCVDQHFGSSQGFYVYYVNRDNSQLIAHRAFAKELKDGNEDKLKAKMAWLVGCDLVYCGSIGGSATKQLIALGATPLKVKEGPDIEELIEQLQTDLSSATIPPQLQRILTNKQPKNEDRFAAMDDEWDE